MSWLPSLLNKLPAQTRTVVLTCVYGLIGSLVAVAFHHAIGLIFDHIWEPLASLGQTEFWKFALLSFVVLSMATLISGWLLAVFAPDAEGSGIPQLKLAYWRDMGVVSREELERSLASGKAPAVPAATCTPDATIGEIQHKLVEAPLNIVILVDEVRDSVIGIFTLHDLLRAQLAESERAAPG